MILHELFHNLSKSQKSSITWNLKRQKEGSKVTVLWEAMLSMKRGVSKEELSLKIKDLFSGQHEAKNAVTRLQRVMEQSLIENYLSKAPFERKQLEIRAIPPSLSSKLYRKNLTEATTRFYNSEGRSTKYHLAIHQIELEKVAFQIGEERKAGKEPVFYQAVKSLDLFYLISSLRIALADFQAKLAFPEDDFSHTVDFDCLIHLIEKYKTNPVAMVYLKSIKLCQELSDTNFKEAKTLFMDHFPVLDSGDRLDVLTMLFNSLTYLSKATPKHAEEYLLEMHRLLEFGISAEVFSSVHPNDHSPPLNFPIFKNYIEITLRLGLISESEAFWRTYKSVVPPTYQLFAKAQILFFKEKYEQAWVAIHSLLNQSLNDVFLIVSANSLAIKSLVEKKDLELAQVYVKNFSGRITRWKRVRKVNSIYLSKVGSRINMVNELIGILEAGPCREDLLLSLVRFENRLVENADKMDDVSWLLGVVSKIKQEG